MFKLFRETFSFRFDFDENSSTSTSSSNNGDIEVQVGRLPNAGLVHVPRTALRTCRVLRTSLVHGCRIKNTDALVFEVILAHFNVNGSLGRLRPNIRNPLTQLTGGCDRMLKLAKAWHLADMLDDVRLQNKLIDVYRILYLELLNANTRVPLDYEAFIYLESHLGTHTKMEKFMIDFFAGLSRYTGEFSAQELLPFRPDVSRALKVRRAQLVVQGSFVDLIATGNTCFNVIKSDATTHSSLQVTKPTRLSLSAGLNSLPLRHSLSTSSLSSLVSLPVSSTTAISSASPTCDRRHQRRLSLLGTTSINEQPEVCLSGTLASIFQSAIGATLCPCHTRSVSLTTPTSSRAPFMAKKAVPFRQQVHIASEDDSSDDDIAYDIFPSGL